MKRPISLTLILVLLVSMLYVPAYAVGPFAGGDGTSGNPYQITTWTQLNEVRNYLSSSFKLMNDLDANTSDYSGYASSTADSGKGWQPIGGFNTKFIGYFDGNGKTISDLNVNRPTQDAGGLFGYLGGGAVISNVKVTNVNVKAKSYTGGLVGWVEPGAVVRKSSATGTVTGADQTGSGVVGMAIGGLAGYNRGTITQSYALVNVTGYTKVGGLVGDAASDGVINNCYAKGDIKAKAVSSTSYSVGGLVGESYADISNSYFVGTVTGAVKLFGYLVGFQGNRGSVTKSFYDGTISGAMPYDSGIGWKADGITVDHAYATTINMMKKSTFTAKSWDFTDIWAIDEGTSYPYFKPELITVSFDMNATGVKAPSDKYYAPDTTLLYGSALPNSNFIRAGYTFDGWYTEAIGGVLITSSSNITVAADHTLYAHWTGDNISVNFNSNGGNATPASINVTVGAFYGDELSTSSAGDRPGYTFDGWYTAAAGGTKVTSGSIIDIPTNHALYAQWVGNTYLLNFTTQDGMSISHTSQTAIYGSPYGTLPTASKAGFWFDGWYTSESAGEEGLVTSQTLVTSATDHALFAHWSIPTTRAIHYNGNGNTSGTAIASESYDPGDIVTVATAGGLERTGYDFAGWNSKADETGVSYTTGSTFTMQNKDLTLYAVWQPQQVTVNLDTQVSGEAISSTPIPYHSKYLLSISEISRIGYELLGWFTEKVSEKTSTWNNGTKKWVVSTLDQAYLIDASTKVTNPTTHALYAQWAPKIFNVTYDAEGGSIADGVSGATAIYDFKYGQQKTATRQGYTLDGWYTSTAGGIKIESTSKVAITADQTLYARWIANTDTPYTVGIYQQDIAGEGYSPVTQETKAGTTATTVTVGALVPGTYTGFAENVGKRVTMGAIIGDGSLALGYYFDRDEFTVTLNNNGGSGTTSAIIRYGGTIAHLDQPEKPGYNFAGWYKDAALSIPWDINTDTVTTGVALFAKWTVPPSGGGRSPANGTFNPNDGPIKENVTVLINGQAETIGRSQDTKQGDQTVTTLVVDPAKLEEKLTKKGNGTILTIPLDSNSDKIVAELNGLIVKNMENKEASVVVRNLDASYSLPAKDIDIDSISKELGASVSLKDIKIKIEIAESPVSTVNVVNSAAKRSGFELIGQPFDFKVTYTSGDRTGEVNRYSSYVERGILLPEGIDPNRITTGMVVEPDGSSYHVPTEVIKESETRYRAIINSLTNSTYTVVWHPLEFSDVANRWSKADVNDMGSRYVIDGVGNGLFEPGRSITRAEVAAIMVRALGLKPGLGEVKFSDVNADQWYADYLATSSHYGLIKGLPDGTFDPKGKITRQEAMAVMARSMDLTKLGEGAAIHADDTLSAFSDRASVENWAKDNAAKCVVTGVVSGRDGNRIAPKEDITREEAAAMVRRLLINSNLINK